LLTGLLHPLFIHNFPTLLIRSKFIKMKKNIISFIIISLANLSAICQVKVPDAVKTAFTNKFPGASEIKWEKENKNELEANFKMNKTVVSANFSLDGTWVETETTIPASELPAPVTNAVNAKYPGAVYERTEMIEKPGGKILYEVNIIVNRKKKELELDPGGVIVK
jgi:Putative beta-lactamase-inhibitor-like, PepSY-like